jgi:hypothetical protein
MRKIIAALQTSVDGFIEVSKEMRRAFNDGTIKPARTRENTTPTRFEDFVDEWASAYQAM